jgi:hypothetical protein
MKDKMTVQSQIPFRPLLKQLLDLSLIMDIGCFLILDCLVLVAALSWLQAGHPCVVQVGRATVSMSAWQRSCDLAELE